MAIPIHDLRRRVLLNLAGSVIAAVQCIRAAWPTAALMSLVLGLAGCDLAKPSGPTRLGFEMPGFEQWVKETAAMPVEKQEAAVIMKFKELNHKWNGKDLQTNKSDGVVAGIHLFDAGITDVSPLRTFVGLQDVSISERSFANLSPLKGLELVYVRCGNTQVSDLSPLKDMEIRSLDVSNTPVSDLSPLKDMEMYSLNISNTQVTDLSALKSGELHSLNCKSTAVSDLSPLKTLGLRELTCDFKPERDSAILRAMDSLERINGKQVAEFWKEVDAQNGSVKGTDSIVTQSDAQSKHNLSTSAGRFEQWVTETADLSAEQQAEAVTLKLKELNPKWPARSLVSSRSGSTKDGVTKWVVTGIDLENGLTDISPVRAFLGLDSIKISDSLALDLSPLKGRRLRSLDFNQMKVPDLTPLQEVKLDSLSFWDTNAPDLSPLNGRKIQ